ncbi:MAG: cytochrome c biogenesis CcdA family protein, partial [Bowdeniella nasicola]|nr:cytochrome c biogenesis CcdA family protein [Bowdeniella nasicola]
MTTIGIAGAFFGGIATLLSPCAALLLPGFFASAFASRTRLLAKMALFYLGLVLTLVPLGALAGGMGQLLVRYREVVISGSAIIIIVLGVLLACGVSFRLPGARAADRLTPTGHDRTGSVAIFFLGITYGVAGGCSGPILGSVLTVASLGGSATYGAVLLAVYALGMLIPLVLLAAMWDRWNIRTKLRPRPVRLGPITTTWTSLLSGVL